MESLNPSQKSYSLEGVNGQKAENELMLKVVLIRTTAGVPVLWTLQEVSLHFSLSVLNLRLNAS